MKNGKNKTGEQKKGEQNKPKAPESDPITAAFLPQAKQWLICSLFTQSRGGRRIVSAG
jgi:hypothetical protein